MTNRQGLTVLLILALMPGCTKALQELVAEGAKTKDAGAASEAKSTEITFVKGVPKAGTKIDSTMKTSFKFTLEGKVFRESNDMAAQFVVQAADEFRVTKASIEVKQLFRTKQEGAGDEKKSVNPLTGSRYVVTRTDDGKLTALDSGGAKLAPAQLAEIKENFATAFESDKTREFLPKRPLKIGEKLNPSADSVLNLLGQKDDGSVTVDGVEFILQSATPATSTFAVSLTFTQKIDPKIRLRAKLEGTIDIRPKDSEITSVSLKGPLALLDSTGSEKGTGDLSIIGTETSP